MAKDGDKKNQDLVKEEMRSRIWTPVPYLHFAKRVIPLKI